MKISLFLSLLCSAAAVAAWPPKHRQSTVKEGFAFDNPIGPTTGGSGAVTIVTTSGELLEAVRGNSPKVVHLSGNFTPAARLKVGSNTSLLGLGHGANIVGKGIDITNSTNVIVQNIAIRFVEDGDGITVQNSTRVWVDHCEFESQFSVEIGPDFYV
jgi:pectate lyase